MADTKIITIDDPVLRTYLFYSSILALKMLAMSPFTGIKRILYKVFVNPEDGKSFDAEPKTDERVERIRRAHLNDLENIPVFFICGLIYTLTNPSPIAAKALFITYTIARFGHTFVYTIYPLPQPSRVICFFTGLSITAYMAITGFIHFIA
ncbi:microsomal glutathione S-transferase 1-like [Diorhabda carinulata]|uniref:microsomal glutathione S-transferase 1-like n=1 Tax=Diorhabda carinulata TaxID=1163345 RepID=UPI0025A1BFCB|nr:microsomal glutathione S-transferase 1-like [Diorhabda carinulata]